MSIYSVYYYSVFSLQRMAKESWVYIRYSSDATEMAFLSRKNYLREDEVLTCFNCCIRLLCPTNPYYPWSLLDLSWAKRRSEPHKWLFHPLFDTQPNVLAGSEIALVQQPLFKREAGQDHRQKESDDWKLWRPWYADHLCCHPSYFVTEHHGFVKNLCHLFHRRFHDESSS